MPIPHKTATRAVSAAFAALFAVAVSTVVLAAPALALRGHEFTGAFGGAGSGAGQFSVPTGVAVDEATGNVYVVDQSNNRVEVFDRTGKYLRQITGASATGTGSLTSGSKSVEGVSTASGAFVAGETVSAPGLPAGTKIVAVGSGTFEVSQAATATETASLSAQESFAFILFGFNNFPQSEASGVAVDNSCHLKGLSGSACTAADPSNGDVYVADMFNFEHSTLFKFDAQGEFVGQVTGRMCGSASGCNRTNGTVVPSGSEFPFEELEGVAVDRDGGLWVLELHHHPGNERVVSRFDDTTQNAFVSSPVTMENNKHPFATLFAVGCKDQLYIGQNDGGDHVMVWSPEGALLSEEVNDAQTMGVGYEMAHCDVYPDEVTSVGRFTSDLPPLELERFGGGHLVEGSGVAIDSATETVYVADAGANVVDVFGPEPPGPPTVQHESVLQVTSGSAVFEGEVNPRGASTEYWFEYGVCASLSACPATYEARTPAGFAGSEFEPETVSANPRGLLVGTTYHVRVVAENSLGTVYGKELTFTTQPTAQIGTADGRVWELVSPPDKRGATIMQDFQGYLPIQAAANGDAMAFVTSAPTEASPQGFAGLSEVISGRGSDGWRSQDLTIPHAEPTGQPIGSEASEYRFFSSDLSVALVKPLGPLDPVISEEASEPAPFLHTDNMGENPVDFCTVGCYRPLVTGCPAEEACPPKVQAHQDVPAGIVFGKCEVQFFVCGPEVYGANADLSSVVLRSKVALTEVPVENGLYEWTAGNLRLVSVLPENEGRKPVAGSLGSSIEGYSEGIRARAVSKDGSRVVWIADKTHALYVYDNNAGGEGASVRLDAVQGGTGEGKQKPLFQGASSDGSRVFFTDEQKLKTDSGAAEGKPDLYECEVTEPEPGTIACQLTDLTPANGGEPANVQTYAPGVSENGATIYFVATGVLASNHNAANETAVANADNLYVSSDGKISFIARLSSADSPDSGGGSAKPRAFKVTSSVSANGRWLAFMSQRSLTGYDNRDARSGKPDEEVYLYDAVTERLVCVSCNPTGARPSGTEYSSRGGEPGTLDFGTDKIWENGPGNQWLAANVPGWTTPVYQSRYLDGSGLLFFNSRDALVPQDVNGTWDVYEYEPPGVPAGPQACSTSSPAYSERSGGCVSLVSSGRSPEDSAFLDASESGGDVFFVTSEKLVSQDFDASLDVYDAHECTTGSPCVTPSVSGPSPCDLEAGEASCRPAQTPQPVVFGVPASATFSAPAVAPTAAASTNPTPRGLTNARKLANALKGCRKRLEGAKRRKQRQACERTARKRYGGKSRGKAGTSLRRGR